MKGCGCDVCTYARALASELSQMVETCPVRQPTITHETTVQPVTGVIPVGDDIRLIHIVRRGSWPFALCGAEVKDYFGGSAPGRDRCMACIRINAGNGAPRVQGYHDPATT